jgi:signal transduction histidine kinase
MAAASVREAISIAGASMKNNRIELEDELEDGLRISGHPHQYAQAVLNVMVNAKEAMIAHQFEDGRIRMKLAKAGEEAELTIEDEGGGIPGDILPKIFDPYYTTKDQGSGIGLYMVKMIVENSMGGRVEAANTGKGARFVFRVPLLALAAHEPQIEPLSGAAHQGLANASLAKG